MSRSRLAPAVLALGLLAGTAGAAAAVAQPDDSESESALPIYCYRIIRVDGKRYYEPINC